MKKIGLLNFQYSNENYGAVLQAAALEHICRQLGHDVRHIDFMPKSKMGLKPRIGQLLRKLGLRKNQFANEEVFERFRQRSINRTRRINSAGEFQAIAKSLDSVIVGSDQVWRPEFSKDTIGFFLGYVPEGTDRIAYAASYGTTTWEQSNETAITEQVQAELSLYKAISCREESGVQICKDVFGVEAEHVLDPLLLVEDAFFEKVKEQSSVKSEAGLVYCKLDSSADFSADLKTLVDEFGIDAVNIYSKSKDKLEYREVPDWLVLLYKAQIVVTDSFHCICLALRFGKTVIYCPNERRGQTRLDSLFKQLAIETEPLDLGLKTPMFKLVSHEDIGTILRSREESSLDFLKEALNG